MHILKIISLFVFSLFLSCQEIVNSASDDKYRYTEPIFVGTDSFLATMTVLQNTGCFNCHFQWSSFTTDDFISNGLVDPQNTEGSKIYFRNSNATVGPGPRNMPTNGSPPISTNDLEKIQTWIMSI